VIREGLYSESYPLYTAFFDLEHPVNEIKILQNGSGPEIAWVKHEELEQGTAELLTRFVQDTTGFEYRNQKVLWSGSNTLTLGETVTILGKLAKHHVHIRQVSVDDYLRSFPSWRGGFRFTAARKAIGTRAGRF
jgi:hypothetical protein